MKNYTVTIDCYDGLNCATSETMHMTGAELGSYCAAAREFGAKVASEFMADSRNELVIDLIFSHENARQLTCVQR